MLTTSLDQMTEKEVPAAGSIPAVNTFWHHYLNGTISDLTDSNGNDVYTLNNGSNVYYDTAGRLVRVDTTIPGLPGVTGPLTANYTLDADGNRTQLTWPDAYFVTYSYDTLNRMTVASENGTSTLATYTYDAMARRTNLAYPHASVAYTYSDAGDLQTLNHSISGTTGTVPHYTLSYTPAHQLSDEASSDPTYVWQAATLGTDAYATPNALNQYPAWTPAGSTAQAFTYDLNGNMTAGTINGAPWAFCLRS